MPSMGIPIFLFAILAFGASPAARADAVLDELEGRLAGAWLVRVDGENRTRTLKILGLDKKSHDVFGLDAEFGRSVGEKVSVRSGQAPELFNDSYIVAATKGRDVKFKLSRCLSFWPEQNGPTRS